jgi:hypothetical protein
MDIERKSGFIAIRRDTYNIADTLVKEYPGKLVSKAGIRNKFNLPYVRAVETFKILTMDYGFIEEHRFSLRVPTIFKAPVVAP